MRKDISILINCIQDSYLNFVKTLHTYNCVKKHTLKSHVIWEMSGHIFSLHQAYESKSSHITTVLSGIKSKAVMLGSCLTDNFIFHALLQVFQKNHKCVPEILEFSFIGIIQYMYIHLSLGWSITVMLNITHSKFMMCLILYKRFLFM